VRLPALPPIVTLACTLAGMVAGPGCGPPLSADRAMLVVGDGSTGSATDGPRVPGPSSSRGGGANGVRCAVNAGCRTGQCVDGFCCESACNGQCVACNLAGSEGRCLPVPDNLDPDNECAAEPDTTCGRDGACNGQGACRKYAMGVECAPRSCQGDTEQARSTCDGQGSCKSGETKSCGTAVCIGDVCGQACALDPECKAGNYCDAGTCRPQRVQGAACDRNTQCGTGFCVDGVCCADVCTGKCQACNNPGSAGTCQPVADGRDPRRECLVQGVFTCGNAGGCDGKGGCKLHVAGSPCGFGSCEGSTVYGPSTCDGLGKCVRGPGMDCDPYVCNGMGCWTACATNDQCKSGRTCRINTCQ
jgi:hypothetical protein